jgi:hypothetical protein
MDTFRWGSVARNRRGRMPVELAWSSVARKVSFPITFEAVEEPLRQFVVSPAAGKRLIAERLAVHPVLRGALTSGAVVVAGTTNGYVAEELLAILGNQADPCTFCSA